MCLSVKAAMLKFRVCRPMEDSYFRSESSFCLLAMRKHGAIDSAILCTAKLYTQEKLKLWEVSLI